MSSTTLSYERAMTHLARRIEATLNEDEPPTILLVAYDYAADKAGVSDAVRQDVLVEWPTYLKIQAREVRWSA